MIVCSEAEKEEEERGNIESSCVMLYLKLKESYDISLVFHGETVLF